MFTHRLAVEADLPALTALMALAIDRLQADVLTPAQVAASRAVMGLDTQLIADRSYFMVETGDGRLAGCGGWSARTTLYGGDHSTALRDAAWCDPAVDPARVRAMYTHPEFARQGVGRIILALCEEAARAAGFTRATMVATLAGEQLYAVCGYCAVERLEAAPVDGVRVPLVRMEKPLC